MNEIKSMKDNRRSPEEVGISFKTAGASDLNPIKEFLSRQEIDSAFKPRLSDPVRGITIDERVDKKFKQGIWVIAIHEGKIVGCMAVVPNKLSLDVPKPNPSIGLEISEGISLRGWDVERIIELSSVVTDPKIKEDLNVKGIGEKSLERAVEWVKKEGNGKWGLITDSWVGGEMGGFIYRVNNKIYNKWLSQGKRIETSEFREMDYLVRIYSDPGKRGKDGPPTVVYGIPYSYRDWSFFESHQGQIGRLQEIYEMLKQKWPR